MKRLLITAIALASIVFGSLFASTAQAQHPHRRSQVVVVNPVGYGGGYGGYGGYGGGLQYGGYNMYGGYVAPYYPPSAPYGAGFSGGYQPYQQMYYQRALYGLGF